MWLTQSVDLNKGRAEEKSCSDIRRCSSVLWAKVWVTSHPAARSACRPGPHLAPWEHGQRGCSRNGHSIPNISKRTTMTHCQILPYFWPAAMLKFILQKFESVRSVLQSSPLKPNTGEQRPHESPWARGDGDAAPTPHGTGPPVPPARLWSNAHPACGRRTCLTRCETTTCSASTRSCCTHVPQVQSQRQRARRRSGQALAASSPERAAGWLAHTPRERFLPCYFLSLVSNSLLLTINSGTQVPGPGPGSSTPSTAGSNCLPPERKTKIWTKPFWRGRSQGCFLIKSYKGEN